VFNLEQTAGIDAPGEPDTPAWQPLARCDAVVAHMPQRPRIQHGAARAAAQAQRAADYIQGVVPAEREA
jgi:hypothetical protein